MFTYTLNIYIYFFAFFVVAVKFLREVTPYFRKASIISEVGWELQRAFLCPLSTASTMINPNGSNMLSTSSKSVSPPSAPKSPPRADTRYIPLQLTHLARNLKYHDPGTYFHNLVFFGPVFQVERFLERKTCFWKNQKKWKPIQTYGKRRANQFGDRIKKPSVQKSHNKLNPFYAMIRSSVWNVALKGEKHVRFNSFYIWLR